MRLFAGSLETTPFASVFLLACPCVWAHALLCIRFWAVPSRGVLGGLGDASPRGEPWDLRLRIPSDGRGSSRWGFVPGGHQTRAVAARRARTRDPPHPRRRHAEPVHWGVQRAPALLAVPLVQPHRRSCACGLCLCICLCPAPSLRADGPPSPAPSVEATRHEDRGPGVHGPVRTPTHTRVRRWAFPRATRAVWHGAPSPAGPASRHPGPFSLRARTPQPLPPARPSAPSAQHPPGPDRRAGQGVP